MKNENACSALCAILKQYHGIQYFTWGQTWQHIIQTSQNNKKKNKSIIPVEKAELDSSI